MKNQFIGKILLENKAFKKIVSCTPFQFFEICDTPFCDLEKEDVAEKTSFDEEHENHEFDALFHNEIHKWDIYCFHFYGDTIYDRNDDGSKDKLANVLSLG